MGNSVVKQVLPASSIVIDRIKQTAYPEEQKKNLKPTPKIVPSILVEKQLR